MTGARRCDEITRVIDEVLASIGAASSDDDLAKPIKASELDADQCRWAELVRWGVLPRPLVARA